MVCDRVPDAREPDGNGNQGYCRQNQTFVDRVLSLF